MEIEEKLKLAFKQGMRYKNMWTEKHGYNEKFSFDNWFAENKQLLIHDVSNMFKAKIKTELSEKQKELQELDANEMFKQIDNKTWKRDYFKLVGQIKGLNIALNCC